MQEFDTTIVDKPRKSNVVIVFLSRLQIKIEVMNDSFLYEHLFFLVVQTHWYVDIANYLVARMTPPHLSPSETCNLVKCNFLYSWVVGYLFYTGLHNIMRRFMREDEVYDIIKSCHDEPCGGHFATKRTLKILNTGPTTGQRFINI